VIFISQIRRAPIRAWIGLIGSYPSGRTLNDVGQKSASRRCASMVPTPLTDISLKPVWDQQRQLVRQGVC
jgi:hypothetical protein